MGEGARGALQPPPPKKKIEQLRLFRQQEKFGQSQNLKKFAFVCAYSFVFRRGVFPILN